MQPASNAPRLASMRRRSPQRRERGRDAYLLAALEPLVQISYRGHPTVVQHVEGLAEDSRAAQLVRLRRGGAGILDRDVGGPIRRRTRRTRPRLLPIEDRHSLPPQRSIV
jgi:hypothetical protein